MLIKPAGSVTDVLNLFFLYLILPAGEKKVPQKGGALLLQRSPVEPGTVAERLFKEVEDRAAGAGIFLPHAVVDLCNAGV